MKLESDGRTTTITLSRRNLLAGLHKLDMPGSARTIWRRMDDGSLLVFRVEDDAEHYDRPEPPGAMHPETETFIRGVTR